MEEGLVISCTYCPLDDHNNVIIVIHGYGDKKGEMKFTQSRVYKSPSWQTTVQSFFFLKNKNKYWTYICRKKFTLDAFYIARVCMCVVRCKNDGARGKICICIQMFVMWIEPHFFGVDRAEFLLSFQDRVQKRYLSGSPPFKMEWRERGKRREKKNIFCSTYHTLCMSVCEIPLFFTTKYLFHSTMIFTPCTLGPSHSYPYTRDIYKSVLSSVLRKWFVKANKPFEGANEAARQLSHRFLSPLFLSFSVSLYFFILSLSYLLSYSKVSEKERRKKNDEEKDEKRSWHE